MLGIFTMLRKRPKGHGLNQSFLKEETCKEQRKKMKKESKSTQCRSYRSKDGEQCENRVIDGPLCFHHKDNDIDF